MFEIPLHLLNQPLRFDAVEVRQIFIEHGDIVATLDKALDLLTDCHGAYLAAPGHLRRQWNQALFERLFVYDERIADAEVAEPFATLADPELPVDWMVRPSPEPALLLAAVQMRSF